jgi:hypothetical protein
MADTILLRQLQQLIRVKKLWKQIQKPVEKTLPSEDNKKHMHWEWVFPCRTDAKRQREESGIISLLTH